MQNGEMASIYLSQSIGDLKEYLKVNNYTLNQLTSALSEESQNKHRKGATAALTSYIGKANKNPRKGDRHKGKRKRDLGDRHAQRM